jgi:arylsulfatase A-like enzyme
LVNVEQGLFLLGNSMTRAGQLLKKLEDLDVADTPIVVFITDNGAEVATSLRGVLMMR